MVDKWTVNDAVNSGYNELCVTLKRAFAITRVRFKVTRLKEEYELVSNRRVCNNREFIIAVLA